MTHNVTLNDLMNKYEAFILDISIIFEDGKLNEQAIKVINILQRHKILIFTCNTIDSSQVIVNKLDKIGIKIVSEQVITSGDLAKMIICDGKHPLIGKSPIIYHFGEDSYFNDSNEVLEKIHLTKDIEEAEIFLITKQASLNENIKPHLKLMEQMIAREKIALCVDPTEILHENNARYGSGFFAHKYGELGGRVIYTGKPERVILYQALIRLAKNNIKDKTSMLMLAHDYDHDVVGAYNVGIDSAMILNSNNIKLLSKFDYAVLNKITEYTDFPYEEAKPNYMIEFIIN